MDNGISLIGEWLFVDLREFIVLIGVTYCCIMFAYMFWFSFICFFFGVLFSCLISIFSSVWISSDWLGAIEISPFFRFCDLIADWV